MKKLLGRLGCCVCLMMILVSSGRGDEPAVRAMLESYLKSFNEQKADELITFWVEDAVHHDRETGERTEGRDQIAADLKQALKGKASIRISGSIDRIQFVTPDVAKVEGETLLSQIDQEPSRTAFSAILVKKDGAWKFNAIDEHPVVVPASGYEALQDLSWFIGQWTDQGEQTRVETKVDWTPGGNFLIRSYVVISEGVEAASGTQVIGWDPREQSIRSWSFNSDGSFGDGDWSASGDQWLIRSSQTLADGQAASGTYVLEREGDTAVLRLIGHEIEGEPQPTKEAVVMVRVEPVAVSDAGAAPAVDQVSDNKEGK